MTKTRLVGSSLQQMKTTDFYLSCLRFIPICVKKFKLGWRNALKIFQFLAKKNKIDFFFNICFGW